MVSVLLIGLLLVGIGLWYKLVWMKDPKRQENVNDKKQKKV